MGASGVRGAPLRLAGDMPALERLRRRGRARRAAPVGAEARRQAARGHRPRRRWRAPQDQARRRIARPDGGRRLLLLHDLPGPAGSPARIRARRPRPAPAPRRRGSPLHRRRSGEELLRGRLRRGGLPRLPDHLGPGRVGGRAARSARRRPGADRSRRLRPVPEEPVAALPLHRPARDGLPRVARAEVPRPARSGGRDIPGHAGAGAQRRSRCDHTARRRHRAPRRSSRARRS